MLVCHSYCSNNPVCIKYSVLIIPLMCRNLPSTVKLKTAVSVLFTALVTVSSYEPVSLWLALITVKLTLKMGGLPVLSIWYRDPFPIIVLPWNCQIIVSSAESDSIRATIVIGPPASVTPLLPMEVITGSPVTMIHTRQASDQMLNKFFYTNCKCFYTWYGSKFAFR